MKFDKIDEVWNSANSLFKWRFKFVVIEKFLLPRQRDVTTSPLYFPKHRKPSRPWKDFIRHKRPSSRALMYVTTVLNCCDTYYNALTMVFWAIDFTVLSYHNFVTWRTGPTRVLFICFCDLGIDNKLSQVNAASSSKPITPIVRGKNVPFLLAAAPSHYLDDHVK